MKTLELTIINENLFILSKDKTVESLGYNVTVKKGFDFREKYDETIKAIDNYKKELEVERDKRTKERNLFLSVIAEMQRVGLA